MVASHHPGADEMQACERVLGEAMAGDGILFAREDYLEEAWRIVGPVLNAETPVHEYEPNTWGPPEVDRRVCPPGGWHDPTVGDLTTIQIRDGTETVPPPKERSTSA